MRKADIARRIHEQVGISEKEAAELLDWILEFLKSTLQKGEPIAISGFGKFTVRSKRPRIGRNPRTGEETIITARRVVTFRPSNLFKAAVNPAQGREHEAATPCVSSTAGDSAQEGIRVKWT